MSYPAGYPGVCPRCATPRDVSGTFDAVLCAPCDEWQSPTCRPRSCPTCWDRPSRPSLAADLDLAPAGVDPSYDLDLSDTEEVLRRVVLPVVHGTLPADEVEGTRIVTRPAQRWMTPDPHWPADVPLPAQVICEITLRSGETLIEWLGEVGHADAQYIADRLADSLEDRWCKSDTGWGQLAIAEYDVLPPLQAE